MKKNKPQMAAGAEDEEQDPTPFRRSPTGGISILETIRQRDAAGQASSKPPPAPRPLVARISLWTPRAPAARRQTPGGSSDSGRDDSGDEDSSDCDDEDEQRNEAEEQERDMELADNAQLEQRLRAATLPEAVRRAAAKELQKLRRTPSFMSDYAVTRGYLELLAELPWSESTPEHIDLRKSRRDLDHDHHGMQKLKERVLQYLAVRKLKQGHTASLPQATTSTSTAATDASLPSLARSTSGQPILMFVGPPGTGKTSIAQSIARSLGRKFQRISLGGVADQSAIRGHRRTYIGAMPGRIIQGIKQVGVNNPVFLLDELDKMSAGGPQGDPSGALLEVLDPEQNHTFTDHYLNLAFDLSRVLFIATANSVEQIPAALLDRMEVIQIAGYTHDEKFNIAKRHLVPKQVLDNGLKPSEITFKDEALHKVIGSYAREAGVRALERNIAAICRVVAVQLVESQTSHGQQQLERQRLHQPRLQLPVIVSADTLESFLGPAPYGEGAGSECNARANVPGVAVGLAWTVAGGEITFVEAEIMRSGAAGSGAGSAPASGASGTPRPRDSATGGGGGGGLVLTGQLGSVMRESALLALNWIRANFQAYETLPQTLGRDLVENTVHVHFPAGAVGKDGPSAGVTIVVALMSLCSGTPVAPDLAMTGEITLRGVVLKVGGVKSKVLAAHRAGIKRVILPARNEPDLAELPAAVRDKMKFHLVATVDEALRVAFEGKLLPSAAVAAAASNGSGRRLVSSALTSKL